MRKKYNTLFYWMIANVSSLELSKGSSGTQKMSGDYFGSIFSLTSSEETQTFHKLRIYVKHTSQTTEQLFICNGECMKRMHFSKHWLSHCGQSYSVNHMVHNASLEWEQILWAVWHLCGRGLMPCHYRTFVWPWNDPCRTHLQCFTTWISLLLPFRFSLFRRIESRTGFLLPLQYSGWLRML